MEARITSEISNKEWRKIADLIAEAIPNTVISKLGNRFGAAYYSKIAEQDCSCGYIAKDASDNILGVVIGATDYPKARSISLKGQLAKLIIAANFKLLSWSVISWVIKGILAKAGGEKHNHTNKPDAELVVIAVRPEAKGTGLAPKLVEEMEKFMLSKGLSGPYTILTEKANIRANRFYKRIGATFVKTSLYHGREINEWHKVITPTIDNEK